MKKGINIHISVLCLCIWLLVSSCQQPTGNITGSEFMPDMAHSIAYEANHYTYYYNNTWGTESEYYEYAKPKKPVAGTVPRGSAGMATSDSDLANSMNGEKFNSSKYIPVNGSVPYHYEDTEEERSRAATEVVDNPFPISDAEMSKAKDLYNIMCGICHGIKGDGQGYLVREGGAYGAQPANFLLPEQVSMSNGQYYHAIMFGKNMMGGYADKLSYEERWNVIHYIRSLQAKELKMEYNQEVNTLNDWATPLTLTASYLKSQNEIEMHNVGDQHGDSHTDEHGEAHGDGNDSHDNNGTDHGDSHEGDHNDGGH